jgi:hypothetical protein
MAGHGNDGILLWIGAMGITAAALFVAKAVEQSGKSERRWDAHAQSAEPDPPAEPRPKPAESELSAGPRTPSLLKEARRPARVVAAIPIATAQPAARPVLDFSVGPAKRRPKKPTISWYFADFPLLIEWQDKDGTIYEEPVLLYRSTMTQVKSGKCTVSAIHFRNRGDMRAYSLVASRIVGAKNPATQAYYASLPEVLKRHQVKRWSIAIPPVNSYGDRQYRLPGIEWTVIYKDKVLGVTDSKVRLLSAGILGDPNEEFTVENLMVWQQNIDRAIKLPLSAIIRATDQTSTDITHDLSTIIVNAIPRTIPHLAKDG